MDDIVIITFLVIILFFLIKNKMSENFRTALTRPTKKIAKKVSLKGKKMTPVIKKVTPPDLKKLTPRARRLYKEKNKGYKPRFNIKPTIITGGNLLNTQEIAPYENTYSSSAHSISNDHESNLTSSEQAYMSSEQAYMSSEQAYMSSEQA